MAKPRSVTGWAGIFVLLLLPTGAVAQTGSGISGQVSDATGGVLPGVTVEAASPALIERARTAVTDSQGRYRIVDLRPGVYTVTFTLQGFNTLQREGIELSASFTATVDAELRVGALEETVTVTGAAPVVDVQNVVQGKVISDDVIAAIPTGAKSVFNVGVLIPGITSWSHDMGGTAFSSNQLQIHGSRGNEMRLLYDGLDYSNGGGSGGAWTAIAPDSGTIQEVSLEVGALSAESEMGGVSSNIIPKEGGNTFAGTFYGNFTNSGLQSDNKTPELEARGLRTVTSTEKVYDFNPSMGGPIRQDRLWFFASYRKWASQKRIADMFHNLTPDGLMYTPDLSRPAIHMEELGSESLRLTFQASERNKFSAQYQLNQRWIPFYSYNFTSNLDVSPEATQANRTKPTYLAQVGWSSPINNRVVLEAGIATAAKNWRTDRQEGVPLNQPSWTERSTGRTWGNQAGPFGDNASTNLNGRLSATIVTGAHQAKFGMTFMHTEARTTREMINDGVAYRMLRGVPESVVVYATPYRYFENMKANVGLFAQDQWTLDRVTLNLGVRFDYLNNYVPAQELGPGPQVPNRSVEFPRVDNVPNWKDVSPRLGVSYDFFGDGKTALKFALGRYVERPNLTSFTGVANPIRSISANTTRSWNDANGDFVPQPGELGPLSNANFGTTNPSRRYAAEALTTRGYNWETSVSLQREIVPRVSAEIGYFRRWYGNFRATDNLLVTPDDYDPFCVSAPMDSRLPGGGGYEICGLYDVTPAKFGQSDNVIDLAKNFGSQREVYDGVDVSVNARLENGLVVSGGMNTGRVLEDQCFVVDSPQQLLNCKVSPPFQPQFKGYAVYSWPWGGVQTSATFQSIPGPEITASYRVSSAAVQGSLGRPLASRGSVSVPLIEPGTMYGDRLNQVDFRLSKILRVGGVRIQANMDLYNMFNASPVLAQNNSYGAAWQSPRVILEGRLIKFGGQVDF